MRNVVNDEGWEKYVGREKNENPENILLIQLLLCIIEYCTTNGSVA